MRTAAGPGLALALLLDGCALDPCHGVRCPQPGASVVVRTATSLESVTATGPFPFDCLDETAAGRGWICWASSPTVGSHEVSVMADGRTQTIRLEVTALTGCCGKYAAGTAILDLDADGGR